MSDKCRAETLIRLCTTRFVERHEAISRFWDYLSSIISTLDEMEGWLDREARSKAHLLRSCIEKPDTLIRLVCLNLFSSLMKPAAELLQLKDGDFVRALELISSVKTTLEEMRARAETEFQCLYTEVDNITKSSMLP